MEADSKLLPKFQILKKEQCELLYQASLDCLEQVGVRVDDERGLEILLNAGAKLDGDRVKIPPEVIRYAVEVASSTLSIWSRDGEDELIVDPNSVYFGPGPTCTYFYDPMSGERRAAKRGDAGITAKIVDALPNLDYIMSLSIYSDVPAELSPVFEYADMVANSSKPVVAWANDIPTLDAIFRIAKTITGGEKVFRKKPIFAYFSTYQSPLKHKDKQVETMLWAAERGIPVIYLGGPTLGIESPVTIASGLVLHLAASLSGLAIVQLAYPGTQMAVGGVLAMMDMRTGRPSYGSPEMSLGTAAAAEMARYLDLPFMGTAGASESKIIDAQAGIETFSQVIFSLLSRGGLVHDVGFLDCADIGSMEMLVLADEAIGYAKRMLRGIDVSPETIMMDVLDKVGPGGHFMAETKSVKILRQEVWQPKIFDRSPYLQWCQSGESTTADRVRTRMRKILSDHHPAPLPLAVQEKIDEILKHEEQRVTSDLHL